ncbi:hypothetical protein [Desulforhopalus singaporensis]|uniref:Uncharacterized protein n=1 Tax=Desulforhopalus singaporensis TaxID=91360 RepID=A0A1H0W0X3_9BACT|nr:hypothetical protein [Desulforhopalus singaporensis]SDP84387.1 hypothetical protein SAMN05660330_04364 [Desulforhopalus singaporensis]SDP84622.1 hypothetical protein SAMN05660330_04376 [Desulforhopalus singaporensis]
MSRVLCQMQTVGHKKNLEEVPRAWCRKAQYQALCAKCRYNEGREVSIYQREKQQRKGRK